MGGQWREGCGDSSRVSDLGAECIFFRDLFASFILTWSDCQSEEVVVVGDLAFHRYTGVLTVTPKQGGEASRDNRRYLDLLRRGADGRWRVWQHIFTVNAAKR